MFMVGFDVVTMGYFSAGTTIIAIPTGIKVYNWVATMWSGCLYVSRVVMYVVAFLYMFTFGGLTGLILANCIIDTVIHDTYFVEGHFHYVLSLGAVYVIVASVYGYVSYFTVISGINELVGKVHYIVVLVSSNVVFMAMHSLGIMGLPRRIFDYQVSYYRYSWIQGYGVMGIVVSVYMFLVVV